MSSALASYTRDRDVLRDQIVAVLLAGRDTTAVTLSWLFYELSRHPQIVQKLRAEIMNFVGVDRHPTYSDLKSMRYLAHTLNETLRLYPVSVGSRVSRLKQRANDFQGCRIMFALPCKTQPCLTAVGLTAMNQSES